jgi:hypothetical protein
MTPHMAGAILQMCCVEECLELCSLIAQRHAKWGFSTHAMHADQMLTCCLTSTGLTIDAQVHLSPFARTVRDTPASLSIRRLLHLSRCWASTSAECLTHAPHQRRLSLQWRYANGTKTCLSRWVAQVHISASFPVGYFNILPGHEDNITMRDEVLVRSHQPELHDSSARSICTSDLQAMNPKQWMPCRRRCPRNTTSCARASWPRHTPEAPQGMPISTW